MSKKLRAGVIGVGTFGSLHARVYAELASTDLVAVADIQPEKTQRLTAQYSARGYDDYNELLTEEELDIVSVCTSDELHLAPVLAAAAAGKHILVEKPLAMNVSDCDTMIQATKNAGVKFMVGQILRFDPRYYAARKAIADGQIGAPVHLFARRNNPKGNAMRLGKHTSVLFFLGVHDIDFINWCVGDKVERVYAESVSRALQDMDTADSYLALMKFRDGTIASLEVSWILPQSFSGRLDARFEAVGTEGTIFVDGSGQAVQVYRSDESTCPDVMYAPELRGRYTGILKDEIAHFVECVQQDKMPAVTGQDGKAAVEVACAIAESLDKQQPVYL
jgi:predicted dehydrogenase